MWMIVMAVFAALGILGAIYIVMGFGRFEIVKRLKMRGRFGRIMAVLLPIVLMLGIMLVSPVNGAIIIIHLMVFWIVCDVIAAVVSKCRKTKEHGGDVQKSGPYYAGIAALVITAVYLTYGFVSAHVVTPTYYSVETDKLAKGEHLRIAMLSDSHTGTLFDGNGFAEHAAEIEAEKPDMVLVCGDMVDDSASYEDMELSCRAVGGIESTYGTYYAYGNHDKTYYRGSGYNSAELAAALKANGIKVLEDRIELPAKGICIIGRADAGNRKRKSAATLKSESEEYGENLFTVVMDHQPNDFDEEAAAGFDLVLSGHTHGGQMFPIGLAIKLFHLNDRVYGIEKRGATTFIVSSGIGDWSMAFKTFCKSEYVIIDICGKQ